MEVPLVLVNTVILFLLLPVIHGNGVNRVGDMALDESSTVTCLKNVGMPSKKEMQFRRRNDDTQGQYWSDHNEHDNLLMRYNEHIFKTLYRLEEKVDQIVTNADFEDNHHELRDVINKLDTILYHVRDSDRNYAGPNSKIGISQNLIKGLVYAVGNANKNLQRVANYFNEVMINSKISMQSLQRMAEIVQNIDARIRPVVEVNAPKYDENDYEFTGLINTNPPTETQAEKPTDPKNNLVTPKEVPNHEITDPNGVRIEPRKFSCDELEQQESGIYKFGSKNDKPNEGGRFYNRRYCDFDNSGTHPKKAWTVIQRRFAANHQLSFNKTWSEYKFGFGDLDREFWFGNDFIHKLTSERDFELRMIFEYKNGKKDWAQYSLFKMKSEEDHYKLVIEGYRGTTSDSFQYLNGQAFSTYDRRHGKHEDGSCAAHIGNGWWFKNCTVENLGNWLGSTSTKMMVRPIDI